MNERIDRIINTLKESETICGEKNAVVGFDGFIDAITRVVRRRESASRCHFFQTITEFSEHVAGAAGKSADMEIVAADCKLGGNAPIMANALASLGIPTICIGAMGFPEESAAFSGMNKKCQKISICDPGYTHAFEFEDGKLMFANLAPLDKVTWTNVKEHIGAERLADLFGQSDLLGFVNWSIVYGAQTIWEGIYREVLPLLDPDVLSSKVLFFDLADPSKRSREDILAVLDLIGRYAKFCKIIVGLNENEADRIYEALLYAEVNTDVPLEEKGVFIFNHTHLHLLLIHPVDGCIAINADGVLRQKGKVIRAPKITTGGGDNFNAGFCFGTLLGFDIADSALLGMAVSGYYVKNGRSPSAAELGAYLSERKADCSAELA